jgi:hypothetical protein
MDEFNLIYYIQKTVNCIKKIGRRKKENGLVLPVVHDGRTMVLSGATACQYGTVASLRTTRARNAIKVVFAGGPKSTGLDCFGSGHVDLER